MHIKTITKQAPAAAVNVQILLDIVLQAINVLEAIERFFGIDIGGSVLNKGGDSTA